MAQDQWTLQREKQLAGSQAARMQSLARETQVWGTWPAAHTQSKASPFEMSAVNTSGARAAQMQSPCAAACKAVPAEHWAPTQANTSNERVDGWMDG